MDSKEYFEDLYNKEAQLYQKCDIALTYYNKVLDVYKKSKKSEEMIGEPIYKNRERLFEKNREQKLEWLSELSDCTIEDIDNIARFIEKHPLQNNENFVDDFIILLQKFDSKSPAEKSLNNIVLSLFSKYVDEQRTMSAFNIGFYGSVIERINEIEKEDERI